MNARKPRLASRRASDAGEEALRRSLENLRSLTPAAVALLQKALASRDLSVAVRAASEICDRSGLPRRSEQAVAFEVDPPKLFDLTPFPLPEPEVLSVRSLALAAEEPASVGTVPEPSAANGTKALSPSAPRSPLAVFVTDDDD